MTIDPSREDDAERLFVLTKEGAKKGAHVARKAQLEALDRHLLAALILKNRRVVSSLCKELRRIVKVRRSGTPARLGVRGHQARRAGEPRIRRRSREARRWQGGRCHSDAPPPSETFERSDRRLVAGAPPRRRPNGADDALAQVQGEEPRCHPMRRRVRRGRGRSIRQPVNGGVSRAREDHRRKMATNGWSFWQYTGVDGHVRPLATAREARPVVRPRVGRA